MTLIGSSKQVLVCAPLVAKEQQALLAELEWVMAKKPDLIEWRADYFTGIADIKAVVSVARNLQQKAGSIPLIFTARAELEGGTYAPKDMASALALWSAICKETDFAYLDCELSYPAEIIEKLRQITAAYSTKLLLSFHDFACTPDRQVLIQKAFLAEKHKADVVKIAVMSNSLEDVLTLLSVTSEIKRKVQIPVITMAMGQGGIVSRLMGGIFGSAVTFAKGRQSSAPGQPPIEDVQKVLEILQKIEV